MAEPVAVAGVQVMNGLAQVTLRRFNQHMIVVVHQHIGMNQQPVFFGCFPELDQEFFLVGKTSENGIAALAPDNDMIKSVFIFNPQRPRHEGSLYTKKQFVNFYF